MSRCIALLALSCLAVSPAWSRAIVSYDDCIARVEANPQVALDEAMAWRDGGGGPAARHCVALAFLELGHEEDAALKLEELALEPGVGGNRERAQILVQAGSAWLLASRPEEASVALTSAIELDPLNVDAFVSRATANRMRNQWPAAIQDLDKAISIDRSRPDAFVLRAVARREAGDMAGAEKDVARALELEPNNIEALVERGRQREINAGREGGD